MAAFVHGYDVPGNGRAAKPVEHGSERPQTLVAGLFGMQLEQRRLHTLMENIACAWTGAGCPALRKKPESKTGILLSRTMPVS